MQDSQQLKHLRRFSRTNLQRIVLSDRDLLTAKIDHRYIVTGFWIVFGVYGWGTFDASSNILSQNDLVISVSILLTILCLHFFRFKIRLNNKISINNCLWLLRNKLDILIEMAIEKIEKSDLLLDFHLNGMVVCGLYL